MMNAHEGDNNDHIDLLDQTVVNKAATVKYCVARTFKGDYGSDYQ
jgi:hypothetical protein